MSKSINKKEWLDHLNKYISANHETILALNLYAGKFNLLAISLKQERFLLRDLKKVSRSTPQGAQAAGQAGEDIKQKISDTKARISSIKSDLFTVKQQCYKYLPKAYHKLNLLAESAMLYVNPELLAVTNEVGSIELQAPSVKAIAVTPPTTEFFDYKAEAMEGKDSINWDIIIVTLKTLVASVQQFSTLKKTAEGIQSAIRAIPEECIITLRSAGDIGELEVAPEAVLVAKDYFWIKRPEDGLFEGLKKDIASLSPDVKGFYIAGAKDEPHQLDSLTPRELFLLGIELGENPHIENIGFAGWLSEKIKYNAEFFTIGMTFARLMANKDAYYPVVQLQSHEIEVFSPMNGKDHGASIKIDLGVMNSKALGQMTLSTPTAPFCCDKRYLQVPSHLSNNVYMIKADSALIKVCKLLINPHISKILTTNDASKKVIKHFIDKCSDEAQRLIKYFLEADELHPGADCTQVLSMLRPEQVIIKGCKIDLEAAWNASNTPRHVEVDVKPGELFAEYPYNADRRGPESEITRALRSALWKISVENVNAESEASKVIHELKLGLEKDVITLENALKKQANSWNEPFKGGPSLASAEEVYKAKMEAVRAAEREKKKEGVAMEKQKVATEKQEKKDFLKSVIIERCDSLGVNEEKLNEAAIILLNSETELHGIDLLFSYRLSERGIVDPEVQEFFNYFIRQSRAISYNKDCKELIRLLTEVYEERRGSSQAQQKASPDELLELLPVELEPEVPLASSEADREAKADHEYLASLTSPSAAENTESAAAAELYIDSVNPIEVAGHVDVPDLP